MRYIIAVLFFIFAYGIRQNPLQSTGQGQTTALHEHEENILNLNEMVEFIVTGQLEHSHPHSDHDDDSSHEHSHSHSSTTAASSMDFISESFQIFFSVLISGWTQSVHRNLAKSFQSELLRPPIVT